MNRRPQVISRATVPLFKYEDIETGVKIDISFDVANGPAVRPAALHPGPGRVLCLAWSRPDPLCCRRLAFRGRWGSAGDGRRHWGPSAGIKWQLRGLL